MTNQDNLILFLCETVIIYNIDYVDEITRTSVRVLNDSIAEMVAVTTSFDFEEENSFIVAILFGPEPEEGIGDDLFAITHTGNEEEDAAQTWLLRCEFNEESELSIEQQNHSMLLKYESVYGILEYKPNKIIMTLHPKNLLIVEHWASTRLIQEDHAGNIQKFYIVPFPNFDEDTFPFLVCSGYEYICLINLKDLRTEMLV